jgi:hypothetical protein
MSTNPFAYLDSRTDNLAKLVEARLAFDASHNQPTEVPVPQHPVRPQPTPKVDLEQFAHLAEVLPDFASASTAYKIVESGAWRRAGGKPTPISAEAAEILNAGERARTGRTDDGLELPEDPTARAIVLAARKGVSWAR